MQTLYFCPVSSSFFLFFPCLISAVADWMSTILLHMVWCGPSANLECRSKMCCTRLAGNAEPNNLPSGHHHTTLSGYIFATKAHIDNRKKKLVKQQCLPYMSLQYGELRLRPTSGWDVLASFQRVLRLDSVTARHSSSGSHQTAALTRGRHLYLAGRPSRWALAHILVS